MEEVAEERQHAWEGADGGAKPAVAGERRAEEVGGGEAGQDVLEDELREVGHRRLHLLVLLRRRQRSRQRRGARAEGMRQRSTLGFGPRG